MAPEVIAKKARARIYIGIAQIDQSHTPEVTKRLTAALEEAKAPYRIELYPGVSHGFVMPDLPVYNQNAAEQHWDRLLNLLQETFG
jgi:carboxymethylenebutenolidase